MGEERRRATKRRRPRKGRARIETSAGGVVFRRTNNGAVFLLIRDPYGNWGLPKGHIEEAETPAAAAVREVAEETRLAPVELHAELPAIDWYFRDGPRLIHKYCHFFLMESPSGEPCPAEDEGISECVWLGYDEAVQTITYDNAREVVRAAGRLLGLDD